MNNKSQVGVILYILMTGEMPWSSMVSLEATRISSTALAGKPLRHTVVRQDGLVGSPSAKQMYRALKAEVLEYLGEKAKTCQDTNDTYDTS